MADFNAKFRERLEAKKKARAAEEKNGSEASTGDDLYVTETPKPKPVEVFNVDEMPDVAMAIKIKRDPDAVSDSGSDSDSKIGVSRGFPRRRRGAVLDSDDDGNANSDEDSDSSENSDSDEDSDSSDSDDGEQEAAKFTIHADVGARSGQEKKKRASSGENEQDKIKRHRPAPMTKKGVTVSKRSKVHVVDDKKANAVNRFATECFRILKAEPTLANSTRFMSYLKESGRLILELEENGIDEAQAQGLVNEIITCYVAKSARPQTNFQQSNIKKWMATNKVISGQGDLPAPLKLSNLYSKVDNAPPTTKKGTPQGAQTNAAKYRERLQSLVRKYREELNNQGTIKFMQLTHNEDPNADNIQEHEKIMERLLKDPRYREAQNDVSKSSPERPKTLEVDNRQRRPDLGNPSPNSDSTSSDSDSDDSMNSDSDSDDSMNSDSDNDDLVNTSVTSRKSDGALGQDEPFSPKPLESSDDESIANQIKRRKLLRDVTKEDAIKFMEFVFFYYLQEEWVVAQIVSEVAKQEHALKLAQNMTPSQTETLIRILVKLTASDKAYDSIYSQYEEQLRPYIQLHITYDSISEAYNNFIAKIPTPPPSPEQKTFEDTATSKTLHELLGELNDLSQAKKQREAAKSAIERDLKTEKTRNSTQLAPFRDLFNYATDNPDKDAVNLKNVQVEELKGKLETFIADTNKIDAELKTRQRMFDAYFGAGAYTPLLNEADILKLFKRLTATKQQIDEFAKGFKAKVQKRRSIESELEDIDIQIKSLEKRIENQKKKESSQDPFLDSQNQFLDSQDQFL